MFSVLWISFACLFACLVAAGIDPYEVLGVSRDADERTIKSQYRQLSKQYHPDKNSDPEAHDKFIEVGEAYGILNDPEKRSNYDQYGDPNGAPQQQFGGHGDMFNQFFNGGFGGQQGRRRGGDTQVVIQMSLQDFFLGKDLDFGVELPNICESCTGSGSADGKRKMCPHCKGHGIIQKTVRMGPMTQHFQSPCDHCQGSGQVIAKHCKTCGGHRVQKKKRSYNVFLAPGSPKNHMHVLEGEGEQNPDWEAGNLVIKFVETAKENWGFRRVGDHLYRTEVLTAKEASFGGWARTIKLFDDEEVEIKRGKGQSIIDGQVETVEAHGMPLASDPEEHGNLYVEYRVLPVGQGANEKDEL